jgi:hypothetical protein
MIIQFGVNVLLDPTWDINKVRLRTKTFRPVFKALCALNTTNSDNSNRRNIKPFKTIVDTLSKSDLSNYVKPLLHGSSD